MIYELELIERAIESARCRIYRVQASAMGGSVQHQAKADDQAKLQVVTIKALEKQIPKKPIDVRILADLHIALCPICNEGINSQMNFCDKCGNKIDWSDEDATN